MFGETMMFATKLLKWYLEHGLVVSNITFTVRYILKAPFKSFSEQVSNERRVRDTSPGYKLRGEMMKLMGNSSYGKSITNFLKHETAKIVTGDNYIKNIRRNNYIEHQDMNKGCEFRFKKMSFKQSLPIHIRFQVYQLAKLRMLQFYYDSIDYSIDKSDYQYCMMDTDSAYIAISDESLEVIKPSLKDEFKKNRHLWLGRDDTIENKVYDSRTPGLFKLEYEGTCIISLASKMYYCDENKFSSKGINKKQNEITKQKILNGAFQRLLTSKGVRHITVEVGDHKRQGIIERFNRTLENIIALYQEARRTNTYIDVLEDIVYNYNHTYHRGINGIPQQLYLGNPSTGTMNVKIKKNAISVGDKVRLLKTRQAFRRGYEPKYSHSIYKVISGNGYSYFIADDDGNILPKAYKYYELQRIESTQKFHTKSRQREPRMTNMERRNKRELEELGRIRGPAHKNGEH
ncbi:hypothetical protein BDEG_25954 [Batrachochytrium dendrobatidis JEL423]|uniref:Integrase catalytic domain-containing protein n=1 Tax=Batrachochytrium dendrobatidis (strain JEL423) TaxID=403673 RepID=A0A177WRH7_BATDL|nr:hypothetical protein BDEG_25954 [Batrachochytrium dendrobatidis JEL423]